jgi:hypothetical protein
MTRYYFTLEEHENKPLEVTATGLTSFPAPVAVHRRAISGNTSKEILLILWSFNVLVLEVFFRK